jgi:hypothetical protein
MQHTILSKRNRKTDVIKDEELGLFSDDVIS